MTRALIAIIGMSAAGLAFAGPAACDPFLGCEVPELDGGMAVLALALTAAVVAIVRERRRS